jgi:hypothetical protein
MAMIEIRIVPDTPEMLARVINLLNEMGGTLGSGKVGCDDVRVAIDTSDVTEQAVEPVAEQAVEPVAEPAAELPEITLEIVRARLAELSDEGKTAAIKEIFKSFGVTKLTEVSADKYAELMSAVEGL